MNNNGFNTNNMNFATPPMPVVAQGFCYATPELLSGIKSYFGLNADIASLSHVQQYFARVELRDPYAEELHFIDRALTCGVRSPSDLFLTELVSNDTEAGAAYDDIRKKFEETSKDPKPAYSLNELLTAGECFLKKLGKDRPSELQMVSGTYSPLFAERVGAEDTEILTAENHACCSLFSRINKVKRAENVLDSDLIVLFFPKDTSMPPADFALAHGTIAGSPYVKHLKELSDTGALWAILEKANGAMLDISPLAYSLGGFCAESLLCNIKNASLAIVAGSIINDVLRSAELNGLFSFVIGRPCRAKRVTIRSGFNAPISLASSFLASIPHFGQFSAKISKQIAKNETSGGFYIGGEKYDYTAERNGKIITSLVSNGDFTDAALTLLEGVCRITAAGVPRESILASFAAGTNTSNEDSAGLTVAEILGLYRTQAELAIPSSGAHLEFAESPFVSVTLATEKPERTVPSRFSQKGSFVYLLAPRYSQNGLPEFRDVRLLLDYIEKLSADGKIISARAVGRSGVSDTVSLMNSEYASLKNVTEGAKSERGGFIVETNCEISGFSLGFTE